MSGSITVTAQFPVGTIELDFSATLTISVIDCNAKLNSASASGSRYFSPAATYSMEEVSQDNFKVALNQATSVLQFNAWKGTSAQSNNEDEACGPLAYELRLTSGSNADSEVDAS